MSFQTKWRFLERETVNTNDLFQKLSSEKEKKNKMREWTEDYMNALRFVVCICWFVVVVVFVFSK